MLGNVFQQAYQIPGTLAANHTFTFKCPFDCTLIHASLSNSSANAGTLKIGTSGDDDAYLAAEDFGVSSACTEVATKAGFDGVTAAGQWPRFSDGDTIYLLVTDHGSHMANVNVVLTFLAG